MKELSIEEKARRYDKAIEIAKEINNEQQAQPFNVMTRVFPELAESEDERMKEAIIATIHLYYGEPLEDEAKEMIAWLEKQVEQKHIPWYDLEKSKEAGYTIVPNEEYDRLTKPAEWSDEDEAVLDALIRRLEGEDIYVSPHLAVKCLKSLKDRVQPKQEWSEEDEKHQLHTISLIEDIKDWANKDGMHSLCIERCIESIDWLILLKERCCPQIGDYHEGFEKGFAKAKAMNCHWTPSDEQIEALDTIINHVVTKTSYFDALEDLNYRNLEKLCNDLKKLREE